MFSLSKLTPVIDDTPVFIMVHLKVVERWAGLQGSIKVLIILHGATFRTRDDLVDCGGSRATFCFWLLGVVGSDVDYWLGEAVFSQQLRN